jgi:integrase
MSTTTRNNRYQEGSIERVKRAKGPDVWVYRWRELKSDGRRAQRKQVIGDLDRYKTKSDAKKAVGNLRAEINAQQSGFGMKTVEELWGDFEAKELRSTRADRSPVTVEMYLDNYRLYIGPKWGKTPLQDVKAVRVEEWLDSLMKSDKPRGPARKPGSKSKPLPPKPRTKPEPLAPATKAKLRNQMSCFFSHAIRHEIWSGANPIAMVRQSGKRLRTPDKLTLAEMQAIIEALPSQIHRVAILIAASTGLRRSEIRGLQWQDVDFEDRWLHLRRGVVRKLETKLKTEGSRRGVPLPSDLAEVLIRWHETTPHRADDDWVLASPDTNGENPLWLDMVLQNYIKPVVKRLGITKNVGWHTWRHSLATLLAAKGEDVKVTQELLRHANARTTLDLYQEADTEAKRAAQEHTKSLFLVRKAG